MSIFTETEIKGCYIIEHQKFEDRRGFFTVPYNKKQFDDYFGIVDFIQENESFSIYGVIRGLHFQTHFPQAKLVRCLQGQVRDVIVDIRKDSSTYGKHISYDIGPMYNQDIQIFIPRGCAHGFSVLSYSAIFQYKVDNIYRKESEGGIVYNDPTLNIDWGIPKEDEIVLEKDLKLGTFLDL